MSIRILQAPYARHTIQDDMESIFYVVLYCAMRWLPHSLKDSKKLESIIHLYFDSQVTDPERNVIGGDQKATNLMNSCHTKHFKFDSALDQWIDKLLTLNQAVLPAILTRICIVLDEDTRKRWQPEFLLQYWSDFLVENTSMPTHDKHKRQFSNAPTDTQETPNSATETSGSSLVRRMNALRFESVPEAIPCRPPLLTLHSRLAFQ